MKSIEPITYIIASNMPKLLEQAIIDAGYKTKSVIGVYTMRETGERVADDCRVVVTEDEGFIMALASLHKQESVLKLDKMRSAELVFTDRRPNEYLGQFRTSETEPKGDYTFDPSTGIYYFCVK